METRVIKAREHEPLNRIQNKRSCNTIRYISFNVNGAKTLFNYHPWNELQQNYEFFFNLLEGDVISLQELKLSPTNISSVNIGNLNNFRSFISLPKTKKGYSGVGLFVRVPDTNESDAIKHSLTVIRAEEGLTGFLSSPDYPDLRYRDLNDDQLIGGYPTDIEESRGLEIDSEGRCVCIELACNIVIFSLYCPANSMRSEEGEVFRLEFLEILLKRCYHLKHVMGKEVIIMGDINVSIDLIDHADTINEKTKQKLVKPVSNAQADPGMVFEKINHQECLNFKISTPARKLLNSYTFPTLDESPKQASQLQFLHDTTRHVQGRRMGMYTVWNTLTGARQSNFGSRIDLILTSSETLLKNVSNADIWPYLMGSDHCPVFTDYEVDFSEVPNNFKSPKLKFEAKLYYKLVKHRDIFQMFSVSQSSNKKQKPEDNTQIKKRKVEYVSRKKTPPASNNQQSSIGHFFFKDDSNSSSNCENDSISSDKEKAEKSNNLGEYMKPTSIISLSNKLHGEAPKCYHGDNCKLKTSLQNSKTRGKKFWCCPRTSLPVAGNESNSIGDHQCSYFKWVNNGT